MAEYTKELYNATEWIDGPSIPFYEIDKIIIETLRIHGWTKTGYINISESIEKDGNEDTQGQ